MYLLKVFIDEKTKDDLKEIATAIENVKPELSRDYIVELEQEQYPVISTVFLESDFNKAMQEIRDDIYKILDLDLRLFPTLLTKLETNIKKGH